VPNGARFRASYLGGDLVARGVLSGLSHAAGPGGAVTSPERATTVLHAGEQLNLSQNPVRFAPLVINYESRPTAVSIFTAAGTRVRVLSGPQLEEGRASWDLNNDRGDPVASGVYLLVIEAPTGRILRKLIVAR
jgi:hypothetical protein